VDCWWEKSIGSAHFIGESVNVLEIHHGQYTMCLRGHNGKMGYGMETSTEWNLEWGLGVGSELAFNHRYAHAEGIVMWIW
jgi:hypothetical protein